MCVLSKCIFTVGYSGYHQDLRRFLSDLRTHGINVVVDVRTSPYSKYTAEFNRETISAFLKANGLKYVFMGHELGARPRDESCYVNGVVDYDRIRAAGFFQEGLTRIMEGIKKGYTISLMCAEKDPICCHRNILVAHSLSHHGIAIKHLIQLVPGEPAVAEEAVDTESRLLEECDMDQLAQGDFFMTNEERIEKAYRARFKEIAYREDIDNEH